MSATNQASKLLQALQPAPQHKTRPIQIIYNGTPVVLVSGKSLWKTKGHAKSALRNHVESNLTRQQVEKQAQTEPSLAHLTGYAKTSAYEELIYQLVLAQVKMQEV
jgi:hypothetical protein